MIDVLPDVEPLPELPPLPQNSAALAAFPAPDRVHMIMRLMYDVTHLSEDRQKLLLFYLTKGLREIEKAVKDMDRIAVASKLAQFERVASAKGNGESKP